MKSSSAHTRLTDFFSSYDNGKEWLTMKLTYAVSTVFYFIYCLYKYPTVPFPMGICQYIDCSAVSISPIRYTIIFLLLVLAVLYIAEKAMMLSTLGLSIISVLILSLDESNANPAENGIISLIFIAQFISYLLKQINPKSYLEKNRIQFPIQIIAAVYTLAGLSKLHASGIKWFWADAPKFALEMERVFYAKYSTSGILAYAHRGDAAAAFMTDHLYLLRSLLLFSLLLELFAFIMLLGKRQAWIYAILLVGLHAAIYFSMDIFFPTIMLPMVIIAINPFYTIPLAIKSILPSQ